MKWNLKTWKTIDIAMIGIGVAQNMLGEDVHALRMLKLLIVLIKF
jgi:hypothetical protein